MKRQRSSNSSTSGFTLLEVLVVVIIVSILAAIAAPGWLAFMNQQRVSAARNQITQAIRDAQDQAKRTKVNRAIVLDNNSDQPRFTIVPVVPNGNNQCPSLATVATTIRNWETLGNRSIQQGTIRLTTKTETGTVQLAQPTNDAIYFDTYGNVASCSPVQPSYTITVQTSRGLNPRRCVRVVTLLGSMQEDTDSGCDS